MWKLYSQPWSAWPLAFQGRLVTWSFELPLAVDVVVAVAIARFKVGESACLDVEESLGRSDRRGYNARMTARSAMRVAAVLKEIVVGLGVCGLGGAAGSLEDIGITYRSER